MFARRYADALGSDAPRGLRQEQPKSNAAPSSAFLGITAGGRVRHVACLRAWLLQPTSDVGEAHDLTQVHVRFAPRQAKPGSMVKMRSTSLVLVVVVRAS